MRELFSPSLKISYIIQNNTKLFKFQAKIIIKNKVKTVINSFLIQNKHIMILFSSGINKVSQIIKKICSLVLDVKMILVFFVSSRLCKIE